MEKIIPSSFVLGEVFRHNVGEGDTKLWLSSNTQAWLTEPYRKNTIPVRTDLGPLSRYSLPGEMADRVVQKVNHRPGCMSVEVFACIIFLLIFEPALAQERLGMTLIKKVWYLFHVKLGTKKVTFLLYWWDDAWILSVDSFDHDTYWRRYNVFLFFSRAKTLPAA